MIGTIKLHSSEPTNVLMRRPHVFINNQVNLITIQNITGFYKETDGYITEINFYGSNIEHMNKFYSNLAYLGFKNKI